MSEEFLHLEIIRGDTSSFKFLRKNETGDIIAVCPYNMWITFKWDNNSDNVLFQKRLSNNTIIFDNVTGYYQFTIESEDTATLDYKHRYMFDISVAIESLTNIKTIQRGTLTLLEETTHKQDEITDVVDEITDVV